MAIDFLEASPPKRKRKAPVDLKSVRARLLAIEAQLNDTFVERQEAIRVILLGTLSAQNYLLVGPPGTAKTSVIDCFTMHIDGLRFKCLMGRFTQPDDVFGGPDIAAFKQSKRATATDGMFTECYFPILDELLKASDGCTNSLLGVLGPEREFERKRTKVVCTGAATNWPEVETLSPNAEAFYDRMLLRCSVNAVDRTDKAKRRALYRAALAVETYSPVEMVTPQEMIAAATDVRKVVISDAVIDMLDDLIGRLLTPRNGKGASAIETTDRRATQLQRILQVQAWLGGRHEVRIEDFDILRHGLWAKRRDLETVNITLANLDAALVQEIDKLANEGRAAYRQLQAQGFGAAKVNDVTSKIRSIAAEVKQRMEQPVFTTKGRDQVKQIMAALRADFEELDQRATKSAGK